MDAQISRHDHEHGDEDYRESSAAEQLRDADRALQLRDQYLTDAHWWADELEQMEGAISKEIPSVLASMASAALAMARANPQGADLLAWGIANEFSRFVRNIASREARDEAEQVVEAGGFEAALK